MSTSDSSPSAEWLELRTCVAPGGHFVVGRHNPQFRSKNLRQEDHVLSLGKAQDGKDQLNLLNFPADDVEVPSSQGVYEIANPLPFRGVTYIGKAWADAAASDPTRIAIPLPKMVSMEKAVRKALGLSDQSMADLFANLPGPVKLALATTSTDPQDLKRLAENSCRFVFDADSGRPKGLAFGPDSRGRMNPIIYNKPLYEAVANNPFLDNAYKEAMVLRPGIQGSSEIVGEWRQLTSHVFEYLRGNSYIPWGHYAANMAHDTVRYTVGDLTSKDMIGMRHLYYQRTIVRLAEMLGVALPVVRQCLSPGAVENLRRAVVERLADGALLDFTATLWGWNYGFDYAPSGYRLHASHQQIHQQFALIPGQVPLTGDPEVASRRAFACGDMIADFMEHYASCTGASFFDCYEAAIRNNSRMDRRKGGPASLMIFEDANVMLFVPKAQTSQWELQLMPKRSVGNIIEADAPMRRSLDRAILAAMRILTRLGASMITVCEYSKRFDAGGTRQRLLYTFLPRLPESPGAFSEAQLRWINGHYPEDFALACRLQVEHVWGGKLKSV